MIQSIKNIAYVAGILEGEGYFTSKCSPTIRLCMTDKDVVIKVRNIMCPNKNIHEFKSHFADFRCKQKYTFNIHANLAIQWMMTIYPLMGSRRKDKIRDIIAIWKSKNRKSK